MSLDQLNAIQRVKIDILMERGWTLTHVYGDGVANLARIIDGEQVFVFVSRTGQVQPPRSHSTMRADAELRDHSQLDYKGTRTPVSQKRYEALCNVIEEALLYTADPNEDDVDAVAVKALDALGLEARF